MQLLVLLALACFPPRHQHGAFPQLEPVDTHHILELLLSCDGSEIMIVVCCRNSVLCVSCFGPVIFSNRSFYNHAQWRPIQILTTAAAVASSLARSPPRYAHCVSPLSQLTRAWLLISPHWVETHHLPQSVVDQLWYFSVMIRTRLA